MKKVLSALLILCLMCTMIVPITAQAAVVNSGTCGTSLRWELDDAGTLTISGSGAMTEYFNLGKGFPWYLDRTLVKEVVVKEGVTSIAKYAFDDCTNLSSVTISSTVSQIGYSAFGDINVLKGIWVNTNSRYYSSDANGVLFNKNKTELIQAPKFLGARYDIPYGVTTISEEAFLLSYVNFVFIPNSVTTIGRYAFSHSTLKTLVIPESVTYIEVEILYDCSVRDIWYMGSEEQRSRIEGWENIGNYAWHYNCCVVDSHIYDDNGVCTLCGFNCLKVYDNVCDSTCNICGRVREVPDHVYSGICDAYCNECYTERTAPDHTYDNACDEQCNECGAWRRVLDHIYDNACDEQCNECGAWRRVLDHIYDNDCDPDCNECGTIRTELIHSFTEYHSNGDATCLEDGTETAKCDRCNEIHTRTEEGSALDHSFTEYHSNGDATCLEDGTETAKCDRCNEIHIRTEEGSALGHSFTEYHSNRDATCLEDGTETAKCNYCDETHTRVDDSSALGHSFTNYISNNDATFEEDGTETAKCDRCDETDTRIDGGSRVVGTGWFLSGGKWYYYNNGVKTTGWLKDGGFWYYFNKEGVMQTGWLQSGSIWYYLKPSGNMATGWAKVGNTYYYFDSNGYMKTGWIKDGGLWYYLQSSGAMKTGWMQSGKTWYYFRSSGAMATGWALAGGVYYYFDSNGYMKTGWIRDGGKWYYMASSGAMTVGWKQIGSTWYYFNASGAMHTGWLNLSTSKSANWYDAFAAVADPNLMYDYFDIDGNGIPELLCTDGTTAGGVKIYVYYNGAVKSYNLSEQCGFYENGIIVASGGRMGYYYDYVYKLQNGEIKLIASGSYEIIEWEYEYDLHNCKWNGVAVSDTTYYANLESYCKEYLGYHSCDGGSSYTNAFNELRALYDSKNWTESISYWYYLNASGAMVTGSVKIGGKTYNFNASGVCLNP